MTVHFIDVEQADATLFVQDGHVMLFDAATKSRGDELVEYIQNLGINYIDVLVFTHPLDNHMGGSAEVLNNIEVGIIYGPNIFDINSIDTLGWYQYMINAVDKIDSRKIDVFLTGDATSKVEEALIEEEYDLDIEIFSASHHGSDTGNSREFLETMSPEYFILHT